MAARQYINLDPNNDTVNYEMLAAYDTIRSLHVYAMGNCDDQIRRLGCALQESRSITSVCIDTSGQPQPRTLRLVQAVSAARNLDTLLVRVDGSDDPLAWTTVFRNHPKLKELWVKGVNLNTLSVEHLARLVDSCPALTTLYIGCVASSGEAWQRFGEVMFTSRGLRKLIIANEAHVGWERRSASIVIEPIVAAASRHGTLESLIISRWSCKRPYKKVVDALSAFPRLFDAKLPLPQNAHRKIKQMCEANKARGGRARGSTIKAIRGARAPPKVSQRKAASRK